MTLFDVSAFGIQRKRMEKGERKIKIKCGVDELWVLKFNQGLDSFDFIEIRFSCLLIEAREI